MTDEIDILSDYYRVPGLTTTIPTRGAFLPEGCYHPNGDDTLDIYPMTGSDEYLMKHPDALMNGHAVEALLKSCVPAITDQKSISTPDLDVLLLAIRMATYGPTMEVNTKCPKCSRENSFDVDLPALFATMTMIEKENTVRLNDDLVVYLKPYTISDATSLNMMSYNETRRLQAIEESGASPEQLNIENQKSMDALVRLQNSLLSNCIVKVSTPKGTAESREAIAKFLTNIPAPSTKKITDALAKVQEGGLDKTVEVSCVNPECDTSWRTAVEFNPSTFFESGSSN